MQAKPDLGAAYSLRGLVYASMGDDALADDSFKRALQINPRDADTMHNCAWFLCQRDRYAEADRLFEQALAQPQYRDAQRSLLAQGVCQARAGRLDEAERKLSRAYELDPTNPTHGVQPVRRAVPARRVRARALLHPPRQAARGSVATRRPCGWRARIENRLGNRGGVEDFGRQLRNRFPQSPETLAYERGRFDE